MKHILIVLLSLVLTGCSAAGKEQPDPGNKEVEALVDSYLEYTAAGNWEETFKVLSGEALVEAKTNSGRVKFRGMIISRIFSTRSVCKDVVEVTCDLTKSEGYKYDRQAYTFRLKNNGTGWCIYKVAYGGYLHAGLVAGNLPESAGRLIKRYMEMTYTEKHAFDYLYLAGKLLQDSQKAILLPVDEKTVSEQQKIVTTVKSMECLGKSPDYAVVSVGYEVIRNDGPHSMEALIDVLTVNGSWRICRMDVTSTSSR